MTLLSGRAFARCLMLAAAAALLIGGCGGSSNGNQIPEGRNVSVSGQYGPLQITLSAFTVYQRGQTVPATVTLTNTSAQNVRYGFGGCEEYAVPVTASDGPDGQEIAALRDLSYDGCDASVKNSNLQAGQTRRYYVQWNQNPMRDGAVAPELVPPGRYRLRGVFLGGIEGGEGQPPETDRATPPLEITIY